MAGFKKHGPGCPCCSQNCPTNCSGCFSTATAIIHDSLCGCDSTHTIRRRGTECVWLASWSTFEEPCEGFVQIACVKPVGGSAQWQLYFGYGPTYPVTCSDSGGILYIPASSPCPPSGTYDITPTTRIVIP